MVTQVLEEHTASVFRAKVEELGFPETLGLSTIMHCVILQKNIKLIHTAVRIPSLA
jgi:hypothetical protein